jgi:hypothetical protein
MEEVMIGEQLWELKSDHKPLYLSLIWDEQQQHGDKINTFNNLLQRAEFC